MKKLFVFSFLVVVFVGFTACSSSKEKSSDKVITKFTVSGVDYTINNTSITHLYSKTAADTWPGAPTTKVAPTIVWKGAKIEPLPEVTQDFLSAAVTYTITAEDGSKQSYSVKAEKSLVIGQ